jgi:hypothetical protein
MSNHLSQSTQSTQSNNYIKIYQQKLDTLKENCLKLETESELKDLFKGVTIMLIKDVILLYNKLLIKIPTLKFSESSNKITNLNTLLNSLEGDGKLFNIDCNDIILRSYITYFYMKYRDDMIRWNLEKIKLINESNIKNVIVATISSETILDDGLNHLNIIPEIVLMINNLSQKDIIKLTYLLNNMNIIIDIYFFKKMSI